MLKRDRNWLRWRYRHNGKAGAEAFFLEGMTQAMHRLAQQGHPAFPVTIYYAFKQAETDITEGTASTGWETFLEAVIRGNSQSVVLGQLDGTHSCDQEES